jgi:phosphate transport system protein
VTDVVGIELAAFDDVADPRRGRRVHLQGEPIPLRGDIRPGLHRAIDAIADELHTMADMVVAALSVCATALRGERADVHGVIEGDALVNEIHGRVRREVLGVLTTQAPLARDLRGVVAALLIDEELERMGDHCVSIARQCGHLDAADSATRAALAALADQCIGQIRTMTERMVARDCDGARAVAARDPEINASYHEVVDRLLAGERDGRPSGPAIVLVAHHLERIGDRVTNIAEHLVFAVEGDMVELG